MNVSDKDSNEKTKAELVKNRLSHAFPGNYKSAIEFQVDGETPVARSCQNCVVGLADHENGRMCQSYQNTCGINEHFKPVVVKKKCTSCKNFDKEYIIRMALTFPNDMAYGCDEFGCTERLSYISYVPIDIPTPGKDVVMNPLAAAHPKWYIQCKKCANAGERDFIYFGCAIPTCTPNNTPPFENFLQYKAPESGTVQDVQRWLHEDTKKVEKAQEEPVKPVKKFGLVNPIADQKWFEECQHCALATKGGYDASMTIGISIWYGCRSTHCSNPKFRKFLQYNQPSSTKSTIDTSTNENKPNTLPSEGRPCPAHSICSSVERWQARAELAEKMLAQLKIQNDERTKVLNTIIAERADYQRKYVVLKHEQDDERKDHVSKSLFDLTIKERDEAEHARAHAIERLSEYENVLEIKAETRVTHISPWLTYISIMATCFLMAGLSLNYIMPPYGLLVAAAIMFVGIIPGGVLSCLFNQYDITYIPISERLRIRAVRKKASIAYKLKRANAMIKHLKILVDIAN